ncbi:hypothetical protein JXO59_10440, partial [candidate division KSB1 bacterium]|nr:hypothetical protein [candidate division KSB1 bacterium]
DTPIRTGVLLRLGILSLVAVAVRYESLFLVVAASIALAVKRRWSAIAALITGAVISVCGFGIFNIANGGPFLPVSLLIKGRMPHVDSLIAIADALGALALRTLSHNTHMYILVLCLILLFWHDQKSGLRLDTRNLLILMALTAILLHLQYARLDWFYRYEAYLLGMAMTVLFLHIGNSGDFLMRTAWRKRSWIAPLSLWILLGLATSPLVVRSALAHHKTIPATKNIYEQQYQMGRFLQTFYNGASVAANDLGAINYLARLNCLDLTGLASYEVLLHIKNGTLSTAVIRELAAERGVQIAVVYNAWYQGPIALPEEWLPVGTWTIRNNIVCGDSTVTFVAVDDAEARQLSTHLRAFSAQLPPGVIWQEAAEQDTVNRHDSKMVER